MAAPALLLGLGVALDDSPLLPNTPIIGMLWQQIESPSARLTRVASLGAPTMRGRHDLAQHFAVSAALTVLVGPQGAEDAGIRQRDDRLARRQRVQLRRPVGRPGRHRIRHRRQPVAASRCPAWRAASPCADFLPEASGLREGIVWKDFVKQYGIPAGRRGCRVSGTCFARKCSRCPATRMPQNSPCPASNLPVARAIYRDF